MLEDFSKDFPQVAHMQKNGEIYLDSAATSLKPQVVVDALANYYLKEASNIHRSTHLSAQKGTTQYEATRDLIAKFISAKPNEVIFTRSTTEGLNLVASSFSKTDHLQKGDKVVIAISEHHSNFVPWQRLCEEKGAKLEVIPLNDQNSLDIKKAQQIFKQGGVKIFSLGLVSNVLGLINPAKSLIQMARASNPEVVCGLDAAQTVSHLPIDVKDLDCDFLAFSGHKIFAPTGASVLYLKEGLSKKLPAYQVGGGMIDQVSVDQTTYLEAPQKFEAGTPNVAEVLALGKAIKYFQSLGFEKIYAHEKALLNHAKDQLKEVSDVMTYFDKESDYIGIFAFSVQGAHPSDVASLLNEQKIFVRAGHNCALPLAKAIGQPSGLIRASFGPYNSLKDVDSFCLALKKVLSILT